MKKKRLIARLDIKNQYVIKGIHLEGLRKIGDPIKLARQYYEEGIDEIIFMDAVASLYGRNNLFHIIESACKEVFIPITIGGGLRSLEDIDLALKSGADKVAINTAGIQNPEFIEKASLRYGSQCIVGSIEAKKKSWGYEAYIETGREESGIDALEWAKKLEDMGAGEIFITSIDQDGTKKGYDYELLTKVMEVVNIPVIGCGGAGKLDHFKQLVDSSDVDALATGSFLHYKLGTVGNIKNHLINHQIAVRS
ncbi:MAG: imidazole glycerol phosphate synthase cyclase subunit [Bacteroidota bacterium]